MCCGRTQTATIHTAFKNEIQNDNNRIALLAYLRTYILTYLNGSSTLERSEEIEFS